MAQRAYGALRSRIPPRFRLAAADGVEAMGVATSGLRVLPTFLIVGGQRCGTNSLYEYLVDHPAVGRALPGQEVHYFDVGYDHGLDWYRGHFPTRLWMRSAEARSGCRPLTGESSPYYMFHPLAPERILRTLPDVRLLVLLRNPVDRAHSHYHHERSRGHESLGFEEALERESARLAGEAERIRLDPSYTSFNHQHFSYLARGAYADQLDVLYSMFPSDHILVVLSESLFSAPGNVRADVLEFLRLPARSREGYKQHNAGVYSEMSGGLRRRLAHHFAASNHSLSRFLGVDPPWD